MNRLTKLLASALCVAASALALTACGGGDAGAPPSNIDRPTTAPPPDTTPPTVGIFKDLSVLPATGPVEFTFVFNEDVGTSFNVSAITVSGGAPGALVQVSATQYTLVVTPPAGTSGTLSVAVRVGSFSDKAGNINVVVPPAVEVPFGTAGGGGGSGSTGTCTGTNCTTFSEPGIGFAPFGTDGGGTVGIENDPKDASNKTAKFVKKPGDALFFGTLITGLAANPVLTASNKTITLRVYSAAVGTNMLLKLEGGTGSPAETQKAVLTTVANAWETLTFEMPNEGTFPKAVVFPNFDQKVAADTTTYIDELKFPPAAGGGGGTPVKLITFDEVPPPKLTDFGTNGAPPTIENDPAGGANKVLKVNKFLTPVPSEQWAGTTISTGPNDSIATIPFTATAKTMTARVYSPAVGVRVRLKVENASNVNITAETDALTTTSGAWEVLTFNFANPGTNPPVGGGPTAALDPAQTYNKLSVFMDFGVGNGGSGPLPANRVYFVDDISFVPAAGGGGGGGAAPVTFSAGFAAGNLTANGGGFGGFSGSNQDGFNCSGDPAFCGSGGNFTGDAASGFFYYYQTPTPATALYMGIYVLAPGVKAPNDKGDTAGLDVGSRANLKFTLGQNAEWFNGPAKNFMIVVDLGKLYPVGAGCRLQLRNVITPSAAAATAYSIPWSSFVVVQNCGTAINTVAAALAASSVMQVSFQGVGGSIALDAGGKRSGANLTIPTAPPVVYPTTLVINGAITFE